MEYIVVFTQNGEGCDYGIGCGVVVETLEADDMEDAHKKLLEDMFNQDGEGYPKYEEDLLKSVKLYEVSKSIEIDLMKNYIKMNAKQNEKEAEKQKKEDYAKFLELQKQFG